MAMNLRLGPEAEAELRAEAKRTGRSQQDLLREAVHRYLGLVPGQRGVADPLVASGKVRPPRTSYRSDRPRWSPRSGQSTLDLLDRDDRV